MADRGGARSHSGDLVSRRQGTPRNCPSVLIAEVRLGDYNGLHLALRAKAGSIPALVLGNPDPVLEREAERLGVVYLAHQLSRSQLC